VSAAARRHPLLLAAALGAAVLVVVRLLVAEPFLVPSGSMEPTLHPGDHVLVDKLAGPPPRRALIVFHEPGSGALLLKRVVAVGGDEVGIADGVLEVNGRAVREPFVDHRLVDSDYFGPVAVPRGTVFVMGDNRSDSVDSRRFGPIPASAVLGRVTARLWPPARIDGL
jgi:signal peptidase I